MRSLTAAVAMSLIATPLAVIAAPADAATVDRALISYLVGPATTMSRGTGLALDRAGNRYVPDLDLDVINVFAADASGNAAPIRTIGGDLTGLGNVFGITLGPDGTTYVAQIADMQAQVAVFAPGADGDVASERLIVGSSTGLSFPQGLALDSVGRLYVANAGADSVTVYPPGADGDIAPLRTIAGAATGLDFPVDVAVDGAVGGGGLLYVASSDGARVTSYPLTAGGDVAPTTTIAGPTSTLDRPVEVAVDTQHHLYVGDGGPSFGSPGQVAVFDAGATGDVAPRVALAGPNTDLSGVGGLVVSATHRIQVVTEFSESVLTYKALVPLVPGRVRDLAVSGGTGAAKRRVSWTKPLSDGDSAVRGYLVVVRKGGKVLVNRTLGSSARALTVRRGDLLAGRHVVSVRVVNAVGKGPVASRAFSVRR